MTDFARLTDERLRELDYPANLATLAEVRSMARENLAMRAALQEAEKQSRSAAAPCDADASQLQEIVTLAQNVPEGPWRRVKTGSHKHARLVVSATDQTISVAWFGHGNNELADATAEYISRCDPETITGLIEEVISLREFTAGMVTLIIPKGWKLVPESATDAMVEAANRVDWANEDERAVANNLWNVMVAEAPQHEATRPLNNDMVRTFMSALLEKLEASHAD